MNQKEMDAAADAVTPELLRVLEAAYPNVQPSLNEPDRNIWVRVGQRQVVEFLRGISERRGKYGRITNVL